jgi:hypothetical protein
MNFNQSVYALKIGNTGKSGKDTIAVITMV